MPAPSIIAAAIQSHASALAGAVSRHSANAARCKVWGAGIVAGVLLLSAGKPQMAALPWIAGVVVLLARGFTEASNRFMAKVPLNGGNLPKAEEWLVLPVPALGWREAGSVLRALGSFSVWPFHAGLLALLAGFYLHAAPPAASADARPASGAKPATAKPLPATSVLSAPTPRPAQAGGPAAFPSMTVKPAGTATLPRQTPPPGFIPAKPPQPQPRVRIPALPPRPQQGGTPPNAVPSGSVPANGVPPTVVPPPGAPAKPPTQSGASQGSAERMVRATEGKPPTPGGAPQNGIPQNAVPAPAPAAAGTRALQPAPGAGGVLALPAGTPTK